MEFVESSYDDICTQVNGQNTISRFKSQTNTLIALYRLNECFIKATHITLALKRPMP